MPMSGATTKSVCYGSLPIGRSTYITTQIGHSRQPSHCASTVCSPAKNRHSDHTPCMKPLCLRSGLAQYVYLTSQTTGANDALGMMKADYSASSWGKLGWDWLIRPGFSENPARAPLKWHPAYQHSENSLRRVVNETASVIIVCNLPNVNGIHFRITSALR